MSDAEKSSFTDEEALAFHKYPTPGKIAVAATKPMATQRDLSLAYSPGVAVPCLRIADDPEAAYDYTPTAFKNGDVRNEAGQNAGSCKLLSFARLHGLSETETLACFGKFYREDVLKNPNGTDHQNIRNFMRTGWGGVVFEGRALQNR